MCAVSRAAGVAIFDMACFFERPTKLAPNFTMDSGQIPRPFSVPGAVSALARHA
jgi:hypothetical protein